MDLQEKLNEIDKQIKDWNDTIETGKYQLKVLKQARKLIEKAKQLEK